MKVKSAAPVLFLSLLALAWIAGYLFFLAHIHNSRIPPQNIETGKKHYDAIIVITGGSHRVSTGFELFQKETADKLFISGTNPAVRPEEVVKSTGIKIAENKISCCVTFGHTATDTKTNAKEVKNWLNKTPDVKRVLLVTSDYHMPRALIEFKHVLPDIRVKPVSVKSSLSEGNSVKYLRITFIEYNKTLITWLNIHFLRLF